MILLRMVEVAFLVFVFVVATVAFVRMLFPDSFQKKDKKDDKTTPQ